MPESCVGKCHVYKILLEKGGNLHLSIHEQRTNPGFGGNFLASTSHKDQLNVQSDNSRIIVYLGVT